MMSIILLLPVAISTDRSTDRPCVLDICNTARIFIHWSNTCVIRRLEFLNPGIVGQMSCTPLPATLFNLASQNSGLSTKNLEIEPNCKIDLLEHKNKDRPIHSRTNCPSDSV